jgi:ABC transporter substrate binding protein
VIECRAAAGPNEGLSDAATELMRLKIDVLVAQGTPAAQAAQRATATTPVVFVTAGDPVGNGLVTSLARPGKNVTGMAAMDPIQTIKGVEFLKESAPSITRVAVLLDFSNPNHGLRMKEQDAAARVVGLELRRIDVRQSSDLDAAFTAMVRERAQAVFLFPLWIGRSDTDRIVEFTVKNRLPTLGLVDLQYRAAGVLVYYTFNRSEQYQRLPPSWIGFSRARIRPRYRLSNPRSSTSSSTSRPPRRSDSRFRRRCWRGRIRSSSEAKAREGSAAAS